MSAQSMSHSISNSLLIVANLFNTIKVTKVVAPDVAQSNSKLTVDCDYSASDDRFTLQWSINNETVYEWRPFSEPVVGTMLKDILDLNYKASDDPLQARRALRILRPTARMREFTCGVVSDSGLRDTRTKAVLVFNAENEFALDVQFINDTDLEINCVARGLYPQPTMHLEQNRNIIAKQSMRSYRNASLYDVTSHATLPLSAVSAADRVTCKLQLPTAGYVAMRERLLHSETEKSCLNSSSVPHITLLTSTMSVMINMLAQLQTVPTKV